MMQVVNEAIYTNYTSHNDDSGRKLFVMTKDSKASARIELEKFSEVALDTSLFSF